jgi:hypothetical protein
MTSGKQWLCSWLGSGVVVTALLCFSLIGCKKKSAPPPPATAGPAASKLPKQAAKQAVIAADTRKQYIAALSNGRKLATAGDLAGAIAAFNTALQLVPNDARVLSELGVVAQKKGDLDQAEKWTQQSINGTSDAKLRGASLYNLGRIYEARGNKAGAIDAYARSLQARPNRTVRERLTALDPAAAAKLDPFAPQPLTPLPSLAAWCDQQKADAKKQLGDDFSDDRFSCDEDKDEKWKAGKLSAPYFEARIVLVTAPDGVGFTGTDYYLLLRTAQGLFISSSLWSISEGGRREGESTLDALEPLSPPRTNGANLVLRYTVNENSWGGWGNDESETSALVIIGSSASKSPSATAPITLSSTQTESSGSDDDDNSAAPTTNSYALVDALTPSGDLELKLKSHQGKLDAPTADLLGAHHLVFQ